MWPPPCVAVSPWSWKLRLKRCDLHIQAFQPFKRCHLCCQPAFNSSIVLQTCFGAWNAAELLLYAFEWTTLFHWKFCRLSPYTLPYLNIYLSQAVTFSTNPNDYICRDSRIPYKITNLHFCQCQLLCWRQSDRSKPPFPPRQTPWSVPKALVARHSTTSITRWFNGRRVEGGRSWWPYRVFFATQFFNICSSNWITSPGFY